MIFGGRLVPVFVTETLRGQGSKICFHRALLVRSLGCSCTCEPGTRVPYTTSFILKARFLID